MNLQSTDKVTVAEVFDHHAPQQKGGTSCDLVSFGPDEFFLVIQGNEANKLTAYIMNFLNELQAHGNDSAG